MEPEAIALTEGRRQLTYRQLRDRSASLASALAALAAGPGDRVAYLGPNGIATFETLFAAAALGAIFVPLNTRLAAPEIAYMLDDSAPTVLVVAAELEPIAAAGTDPQQRRRARSAPPGRGRRAGYQAAIQEQAGCVPPPVGVALSDPALILYTSGTTGRPKGAVLTHGNLTWNTLSQFAHFNISRTDVSLCTAPLFHVLGLGQITLPTLFAGGTVVVIPKLRPRLVPGDHRRRARDRVPARAHHAADALRTPRLGDCRPVRRPLRRLRRLSGPGASGQGVAGARHSGPAGLRHDRGIPGGIHGTELRLARTPGIGRRPALLHRYRPARGRWPHR